MATPICGTRGNAGADGRKCLRDHRFYAELACGARRVGSASQTTCAPGQRFELDAPATVSGADIAISIGVTR